MKRIDLAVADSETMMALGGQLALACFPAMRIYLSGELGTGKTTLVRGFMRGLGYQGKVKSPTYTLVESYAIRQKDHEDIQINHFDLYRLQEPLELESLGWRDYFDGHDICLVEWPERAGKLVGEAHIRILIKMGPKGRDLCLEAHDERSALILSQL